MSELCKETRRLLNERPHHVTLKSIEQATSIKVQWLQDFSRERFIDPGVVKVEKLYVHLAGKALVL